MVKRSRWDMALAAVMKDADPGSGADGRLTRGVAGQPPLAPGMSSGKSPEDAAGMDHLAPDYSIRGEHCDGLDCEYAAVEARYLMPLPAGVDPVQAAAVPLAFVTAWGMLVCRADVRPDETVLVLPLSLLCLSRK